MCEECKYFDQCGDKEREEECKGFESECANG